MSRRRGRRGGSRGLLTLLRRGLLALLWRRLLTLLRRRLLALLRRRLLVLLRGRLLVLGGGSGRLALCRRRLLSIRRLSGSSRRRSSVGSGRVTRSGLLAFVGTGRRQLTSCATGVLDNSALLDAESDGIIGAGSHLLGSLH